MPKSRKGRIVAVLKKLFVNEFYVKYAIGFGCCTAVDNPNS